MKLLASVVAPTTLITALLFYFGWAHAYWFFYHFGIDSSLLGLTTQDYLLRSVDALFVPLTVLVSVSMVILWGHVTLRRRLLAESRTDVLRWLSLGCVVAGLTLFVIGMMGIFYRTIFEFNRAVSPFSLASGVLLMAYASYLQRTAEALKTRRRSQKSEPDTMTLIQSAGVFLLVALSLFWATTDYAAAVGESRARQFVSEIEGYTNAVLYSNRSLSLQVPGVEEIPCSRPDAAYRFRYQGLKLLLRSDDHYFFLPEAWTPSRGAAIMIPQSDSVRLEFSVATAGNLVSNASC